MQLYGMINSHKIYILNCIIKQNVNITQWNNKHNGKHTSFGISDNISDAIIIIHFSIYSFQENYQVNLQFLYRKTVMSKYICNLFSSNLILGTRIQGNILLEYQ